MVCYMHMSVFLFFFFFQAEDGIRDVAVTGVQTCALPIYERKPGTGAGICYRGAEIRADTFSRQLPHYSGFGHSARTLAVQRRSEERRVGKECRSRWSPYH